MLTQQILSTAFQIILNLPWGFIVRLAAYLWICQFLFLVTIMITGDFCEDFPSDADQDLF